ncbi:hypothetical protein ACIRVF_42200 [Kitasatospora sp. NPDC101157]|uniref:hypothetical protein n=1 Tax=Kitasatospora sp. NPDC101157 TaxID=3364098 RepID=UPI00380E0189
MDDQHHPTGSTAAPDGDQALWDSTVADPALAGVGIDVVHAGDGRPGAVLELAPRGLAVAVRWQPTEQHPLPGGALSVMACRGGGSIPARQIHNVMLQSHLANAGLRTVYADGRLVVVHPDLEIPGRPRTAPATAPAALVSSASVSAVPGPSAPARQERRARGWPARWLGRGTNR